MFILHADAAPVKSSPLFSLMASAPAEFVPVAADDDFDAWMDANADRLAAEHEATAAADFAAEHGFWTV